jgi:hypothetical protein
MSVVGIQIAELWSSIARFQTEFDTLKEQQSVVIRELGLKHKEELAELNAKSEKAKKEFASYLKEAGINTFLFPAKKKKTSETVKPRTSSKDKKAAIERNKAIYISPYEKGINDKTGLPNKHKGRGNKNHEIDKLMKNDEEAFKKANK